MPTGPDTAQNRHPQTANFHPSVPALETAARSDFQSRPLGQYPATGTAGHRRRRTARVCTPSSGSAGRCPSGGHRQRKQVLKRKTIRGHRSRSGSARLPEQDPFLGSNYRTQSHQAATFPRQNPLPTTMSCCQPAWGRSPPHPGKTDRGQSNVP